MQHWAMSYVTEDGQYISESHAMLHVLGADCSCTQSHAEDEFTWITCKYGNWCTVEPEGWCAQCEDEFTTLADYRE